MHNQHPCEDRQAPSPKKLPTQKLLEEKREETHDQGNACNMRRLTLIYLEVMTEKYPKDCPRGRAEALELQYWDVLIL